MLSLLGLERKQTNSWNTFSHISISFFHLELKRYTLTCDHAIFFWRSHAPVVPSKTVPDSRPKWPQTIPFGAARTYMPPTTPPPRHTPSTNRYHDEQKPETLQPIKSFVVIFIYCTRETELGLWSRRDSGKNSRLFVTFAESQYM